MGKRLLSIVVLLEMVVSTASAQLVNTGVTVSVEKDGLLFVGGDYVTESGLIKNQGTVELKGNWENNSSNAIVFDPSSTGELVLTGGNQNLGGTSKTTFTRLRLAGDGDKVLRNDADISGFLDLGDRQLHAGRFSLSVLNPDVNAIARVSGFITTDEKGFLIRTTNQRAPYLFPIGSVKNNPNFLSYNPLYRPVVFEPENSAVNVFSVSLNNSDPTVEGYDRSKKRYDIESVSDRYFYMISQTSGASRFNIRFFQNKDLEDNTPQVINWGNYAMWEKLPTRIEDGTFDAGLNRSLVYSSAQLLHNLPVSFASTNNKDNPFTFFNAFSPDGDGKNDRWVIGNIDYFPDNNISIFNRWGDEVFNARGYSEASAWEGGNLQAGTYFCVLKVNINGQLRTFKGFITMVRKD